MPLDCCIFLSFAAESENVTSVFLSGWNGVDAFIEVFQSLSSIENRIVIIDSRSRLKRGRSLLDEIELFLDETYLFHEALLLADLLIFIRRRSFDLSFLDLLLQLLNLTNLLRQILKIGVRR